MAGGEVAIIGFLYKVVPIAESISTVWSGVGYCLVITAKTRLCLE